MNLTAWSASVVSRRSFFWLIVVLAPILFAACSSTSGSLGQVFEGRILQLTVIEIDRTDELRYSTIDPLDVIRRWRMQPSKDELELLLMRLKVDNHIAVNAIFVADQQAAILRGFFQDDYRPLSVTDTVYLDARGQGVNTQAAALVQDLPTWFHITAVVSGLLVLAWFLRPLSSKTRRIAGLAFVTALYVILFTPVLNLQGRVDGVLPQADARVTLGSGECFDHARMVVNAGTNVVWTNSGETASNIQFGPGVLPEFGDNLVEIAPGASVSHRFDRPGTFDYQCSGGEAPYQAQVLVEDADSVRGEKDNHILFLEGTFELSRDTGVDGWMVFEVPVGTKIRDLRWRAGDSITIRF